LLITFVSIVGAKPVDRTVILLLLGWLFLPTVLIYLFLLQRGTFFAVRYILYTLPAYLILVAYGIDILVTSILNSFITEQHDYSVLNSKNYCGKFTFLAALL
jgi:hypothetical protein